MFCCCAICPTLRPTPPLPKNRRANTLHIIQQHTLTQSEKQVRAEGAPEFPGKRVVTEDTFLGDRSDSNSEFVRHRKEQLGSFLRQLFNRNPGEAHGRKG